MKYSKISVYLCIIFFLITTGLDADENFEIDWINGRIYSSITIFAKSDYHFANNRLESINLAREKAKINFYRVMRRINIYESLSVLDYFERDDFKNRELFTLIDNATLYTVEYPDLNSIKLSYFIDIYGKNSLMNIMMSERDIYTEDLKGYMGYHFDTGYTGLIIDARGELTSFDKYSVKVKPALFVMIKDSEGRFIMDKNNVRPEVIREKGMIRYSYDIGEDVSDRVGDNPLKVVAYGTGDKSGSVLVISVENAKRLLSSKTTRNALQNGRIVIIIDP